MTLIKTSTTQARLSRRTFLGGLGASAAFLPLLHSEKALAAPNGFPKRLVTLAWTNGVAQSAFYPASDTDPTASEILKPLAPLSKKVLIAAGLDFEVMVREDKEYDGHFSYPVIYTGTYKNTGGQNCTSSGPSIDQVVADAVSKEAKLAMPLLNITLNGESTSFSGPGKRNTGESNPGRLFNKLFASVGMAPAMVEDTRARGKSVLDFLVTELKGFSARMGTEDKAKIEAHLEAVRKLEMQLAGGGAAGAVSCEKPMIGTSGTAYPDQVKAMLEITAAALRCDVTRVVSIVLGADGGSSPGSFPFIGVGADYHGIAHQGTAGYPSKIKIDTWYYTQVAALATALDASPEGDGTALDNSVVVVGNDMAEGASHSTAGQQFLLVGSCGGYFKTGRVVRFGNWRGMSGAYYKGNSGHPHNGLLASLGNAMGVPMAGFGALPGTLDELTK